MNNNEGFTIRTIPEQREMVCNGCKYLNRSAMLRGHDRCTDNYSCTHPNFQNEKSLLSGKGRHIYFNHEGSCNTPDWCPFLNKQNNEEGN